MKFLKKIRDTINRVFRIYYENLISLPFGVARFMGNVAFIQLNSREYVDLCPVPRVVNLWVTVSGTRPVLYYSVYRKSLDQWAPVQVVVEQRGFNLKPQGAADETWELVDINHECLEPLKDIFLAFAFYAPLRADHKKLIEAKQSEA